MVFAGDNGPDLLVEQRFNLDLRGSKYSVYEGGIRVPFLLRWPNHFGPQTCDQVIHFTDVLPSLVELCELKVPSDVAFDGQGFVPALTGKSIAAVQFWQWNRGPPRYSHNAAMREGNWKLVRPLVTRNLPKAESNLAPQLYDLATDSAEANDLSRHAPERIGRMQVELEAWCREIEADRIRSQSFGRGFTPAMPPDKE